MLQGWIVILVALAYIGLLFVVASYGDRLRLLGGGARGRLLIYPLSLAIYCTSWTFFGSVGLASRNGYDFLTIYLGPIIVVGAFSPLIIRVVRLAKTQNITSIADFIAARYGKSQAVAATVALIAIVGVVPYIALQLKAVSSSLSTILAHLTPSLAAVHQPIFGDLALFVALAMAAFAVLFGTRHIDATEHQDGLMLAIATESVIKLVAFLAVGLFVTFWMFEGPSHLLAEALRSSVAAASLTREPQLGTLLAMTFLSGCAILLLPRQFHVTVVENHSETEIRRAAWVFPLYLVLINLFVVPIALAGLITFAPGAVDSDMFVLALPLKANSSLLTCIAFIGGLSAATAMVIVECVALAIMVSNDLVMPAVLKRRSPDLTERGDIGAFLLMVRRGAIFAIVLLAYIYYRSAAETQLAAIGLLAFAAVAQLAPAFFGALTWRRGTMRGALGGMIVGILVWAYTLLLPSIADIGLVGARLINEGPFGIVWLKPQALVGLDLPPLVHGVMWSLGLNLIAYILFSLSRAPTAIERLQADLFVPTGLTPITPSFRLWRSSITVEELTGTVSRYLGEERTRTSFGSFADTHRMTLGPKEEADFRLMRYAEHLLASAIGAASSRLVLSLLLRKRTVSTKAALKLLDDANAAIHYNREILQTALDHVRQGIAVFGRDLQLICWNRQFGELLNLPSSLTRVGIGLDAILRYDVERSRTGADIHYDRMLDTDEPALRRRVARYASASGIFHERFAGSDLVIEVRCDRMPDGGLVTTFTDITPTVEAAQALERANETLERRVHERTLELTRLNEELARAKAAAEDANISKTRFLAAASHDILQPLNAARLYVTSLVQRQDKASQERRALARQAQQQEAQEQAAFVAEAAGRPPLRAGHSEADDGRLVGNIDASLEAVEEIFGALLDISRLDTGAMKPELANFRIDDLLRQLALEFEPLAREKGLDLRFVPCALAVRSDRRLLRRLLQNLVSNAIKYTETGCVLVGCRRRGTQLRIAVHDTGLGIPRSKTRIIFQEFHRLDQGARVARGLGLGLSIVERIGRVLDHKVDVHSEPGRGSRFSVDVPLARGGMLVEPPRETCRIDGGQLAGLTVLCVDNEPAILEGMETLLSGWGCRVLAAPGHAAALALATGLSAAPSGVLVDYHLGDGDGIGLIDALRVRFAADLPAILITADRTPAVRGEAQSRGITLLHKPLKPAALRALLAQWRAQQIAAE